MAQKFYRKELLSNSVLIAGTRVPFQPLANNRGVIALDESNPEHAHLIKGLDEFAARRKFGIVAIQQEEYNGLLKKVLSLQPSAKRKLEKLRAMQPLLKPKQSPVKAVPAVNQTPPQPSVQTAPTPSTPVPVVANPPAPAFVPRTAPKPAAAENSPAVAK